MSISLLNKFTRLLHVFMIGKDFLPNVFLFEIFGFSNMRRLGQWAGIGSTMIGPVLSNNVFCTCRCGLSGVNFEITLNSFVSINSNK